MPQVWLQDLRAARRTMKANTGRGVDAVGPTDLATLPFAAEQELLDMMLTWENLGTWHSLETICKCVCALERMFDLHLLICACV